MRRRIFSEEEVEMIVRALGCGRASGAYLYFKLVKSGGGKTFEQLMFKNRKSLTANCLALLKGPA